MFDTNIINDFEIGTFNGLAKIHKYLFSDIYDFAGKIRKENIAKGNFRFVSMMYLEDVLSNFENIIKKYIEILVGYGKKSSERC